MPTIHWLQLSTTIPSRFGGWATVPMSDPNAAADELTRGVQQLGFVGALIHDYDRSISAYPASD